MTTPCKVNKTDLYTLRWCFRQLDNSHTDLQTTGLRILDKYLGAAHDPEDHNDVADEPATMSQFHTFFKKSPNQSGPITPKYIILHSSYGTYQGDISWILNPRAKVSYHFLINPETGDRTQFVEANKKAWHVGKSRWNNDTSLNNCSIGIAFTGPSSRKPSDTEIQSCAQLCHVLQQEFPSITNQRILTHAQVATPRGRKDDCSMGTYNRVLELLK